MRASSSIHTTPPKRRAGTVKFILGMTVLAAVFVGLILLGNWQVRRYHLKLKIAHDIATRVHAPPVDAPGPAQWPQITDGHLQYLHVTLHGRFIGGQTLVRGSSSRGYGYWVVAPLRTDRGFIVLVNRGYVAPEPSGAPASAKIAPPDGEVSLTGLLRLTEPRGGFLRHNQPQKDLWYSRDVAAIAAADHLPADQVTPYFVDADAAVGESGPPFAGLTSIHVYNHSLGYAITWYLLALGTLLAMGIVIRHEMQIRGGQLDWCDPAQALLGQCQEHSIKLPIGAVESCARNHRAGSILAPSFAVSLASLSFNPSVDLMTDETADDNEPLLCSNCFTDEGLRIDAAKHGMEQQGNCPNCKSSDGRKLTKKHIEGLAWRFFVSGTTIRCQYGAAPVIQCNEYHYSKSDISPSPWLKNDIKLIEDAAKIGFFHYGPRLWMIGEIEPLKALQDPEARPQIIGRVLQEYPERTFAKSAKFYRLRVGPQRPADPLEYDSQPLALAGNGRLDSVGFQVMYGSQDIDICIHECRAATEDDIYVATLKTQRDLRLLDLTQVLEEEGTEFESLDMAIHMLFLARSHSYEISRAIALAARDAGFDGVIYPSFFSLIRTGGHPFETSYGLSLRRFLPQRTKYVEAFTVRNLALFGCPLESGLVRVECINRLILTQVGYQGHFGPATY